MARVYLKPLFVGLFLMVFLGASNVQADAQTSEIQEEIYSQSRFSPEFIGPIPYIGPRIEINVAARELRVFYDSMYDNNLVTNLVETYRIAVGSRAHKTPIGPREMTEIVWNPYWYPPKSEWAKDAEITPPGPGNPLGRVKMNLGRAILVHGTNKPWSIGRAASHGCMRMKNQDALALARYLQEVVTDKGTQENFAKYSRNSRRSYKVKLENPIPVDVIYRPVEVRNDRLYVYQDVYNRVHNKSKIVTETLTENGYDVDEFNMDVLQKQLRKLRRKDGEFELYEFTHEHINQLAEEAERKAADKVASLVKPSEDS